MILFKFLGEIFESAVNPLFFRKAVQRSAGRAFGYYLYFTTLYTVILCGAGLWLLARYWDPMIDQLQKNLPAVEFRVNEGRFSTNLPQPSVLGDMDFSLIIDTTGESTDLSPYKSALLVTKTKAVMKKDRLETREYNFSAMPDFKVTTADAVRWLRQYKQTILWSLFTTVGLAIIPTIWLFAIPVILFLMLLMMIPAKIIRSNLSYTQMLSIGFYAVTFPTLLETYFLFSGHGSDHTYRWVYLVWCLVGLIVARSLGKTGEGAAPPPPPPSNPAVV